MSRVVQQLSGDSSDLPAVLNLLCRDTRSDMVCTPRVPQPVQPRDRHRLAQLRPLYRPPTVYDEPELAALFQPARVLSLL